MERKNYLSYIRAVACFCIVILHAYTMCGMVFKDTLTGNARIIINMIPYLMMWAVPCFVMVTGALLLDEKKSVDYKKVFRRYIPRVLIALIICCFLFRFLDFWMNKESFSIKLFVEPLYKFYTKTSWAHLWYLYLIVGLYLLMPAFSKIAKHSSDSEITVLIIIYVCFVSIIPIINKISGTEAAFYITTSSIFPAYLFIGHMIDSGRWKISTFVYILMFLAGLAAIVVLSCISIGNEPSAEIESITGFLGSYSFLPVVVFSTGAFGLFKSIDAKEGFISKILLTIDSCSFGIYLIHLVFLRYIYKCTGIKITNGNAFILVLGIVVITFILSFLIVWALRKIKVVQKIL